MRDVTNTKYRTVPVQPARTTRPDVARFLTSHEAGNMIPVSYIPLLREDAIRNGRISISVEMSETDERIMNTVDVRANAYFIPFLAFEQFSGSMHELNKSYMKQKSRESDPAPVDFFKTQEVGALSYQAQSNVFGTLGLHAREGQIINKSVTQAYQVLWNFRAKQRSSKITLRAEDNMGVAPAFWDHPSMTHIVSDFDQAAVEGEVELNVVGSQLPVKGILTNNTVSDLSKTGTYTDADGVEHTDPSGLDPNSANAMLIERDAEDIPQVFAEMNAADMRISLANIDLAKKTQAFARMRERYQGHDDEYIINLLMQGVRIPEESMKQPVHMARAATTMQFVQRYATDSANLDQSVTQGVAKVEMPLRLPRVNTGGVVLVVLEVVPQQLFERKKDYFFHETDQSLFPEYVRDELDPEKVEVVPNEHVDIDHSSPDGTFGYAPLNSKWFRDHTRIGGQFLRPEVDGDGDVERKRFWAVETADPQLTTDFYLVGNLNKKVFRDDTKPGLVIAGRHEAAIEGNTVFGERIVEATGDYDALLGQVDTGRIDTGE